jgi:hypothetical protein
MDEKSIPASNAFQEALSRLTSVSRAEMQKRLKDAPPEKVDKHKRFRYVPNENKVKPA